MSYEKDLDYLSRELRNAQNIYDEAEKDERESDAEMWMNRVTHLEFQIEVFEKATKADEYEAKAKAFDRIREAMDYHYPSAHDRKYLNGYQHPKASLKDIDAIINSYESGEYDD